MAHSFNFPRDDRNDRDEIWIPDYANPLITNPYLLDKMHRPARDLDTSPASLLLSSQNCNATDPGLGYNADINFTNLDSYYQSYPASFVPSGDSQPPALQPFPLGFYGSDGTNLTNNHFLNLSTEHGLHRNTAHQYDAPGLIGYTNPSNVGFNPTLPLAQHNIAAYAIPANASVSKKGPYFCSSGCGRHFTRKTDMERHVEGHLDPTFWRWGCPGCHERFYRKDKLTKHVKKYEGGRH